MLEWLTPSPGGIASGVAALIVWHLFGRAIIDKLKSWIPGLKKLP